MVLEVKELSTKSEMMKAFFLVQQMYEKMDEATFSQMVDEMIERNDYKMVGAFADGKMIGVSGFWISCMLYCGRYLQVSNLVVDRDNRKGGVGKKLLDYLEKIARDEDCKKVVLDSYTENKKSHSLYFRENFYIRGLHYMKDL